MFGLGMQELLIIGVVAVILFGKRLPEVAKTLGKSYSEFRRGLSDIQSQFDMSDLYSSRSTTPSYTGSTHAEAEEDDYEQATAPKFEPPPAEPEEGSPMSSDVSASERA
jgi:sec-independent protein translocase protein TatA